MPSISSETANSSHITSKGRRRKKGITLLTVILIVTDKERHVHLPSISSETANSSHITSKGRRKKGITLLTVILIGTDKERHVHLPSISSETAISSHITSKRRRKLVSYNKQKEKKERDNSHINCD